MSQGRPTDPDTIAAAGRYRAAGKTYAYISEKLGLPLGSIPYLLKRAVAAEEKPNVQIKRSASAVRSAAQRDKEITDMRDYIPAVSSHDQPKRRGRKRRTGADRTNPAQVAAEASNVTALTLAVASAHDDNPAQYGLRSRGIRVILEGAFLKYYMDLDREIVTVDFGCCGGGPVETTFDDFAAITDDMIQFRSFLTHRGRTDAHGHGQGTAQEKTR